MPKTKTEYRLAVRFTWGVKHYAKPTLEKAVEATAWYDERGQEAWVEARTLSPWERVTPAAHTGGTHERRA